jgi:multiple sugar transport system permease protein
MTAVSTGRAGIRAARTQPPRRKPRNVVAHLFLGALIVYFLIPLWWLIVASSKDTGGLFSGSGALWFSNGIHYLTNLEQLFSFQDGIYLKWIGNSVLYAFAGGIGATIIAVLAGYGFAKFAFPGRNLMFSILLGSVMVPLTALVIPTFILFSDLHLTDSIWAVILPSLLSPFAVYLMRVYASASVPDELLDAARIDGCGFFRQYWNVAVPLMRPALSFLSIYAFVNSWNDYIWPLIVLTDPGRLTLQVALAQLNVGHNTDYSMVMAGVLMATVPMVAVFALFARGFIAGAAEGAIRG